MEPQKPFSHHIRAHLVLGLPLIGSHLAQFAIHVVDTVMLGWYDVSALAAVVLAGNLFFVLFIMGSGFAWAVMPMVASAHEAGDETGLRRATRMGLWLSIGAGLITLPLTMFSAPILTALGQKPELAGIAQDYLRIAGWGIFPALIVMVLKSYLSALEHARVVLWVTLVAAVLNGLLNYALIFGNWGAPEMGVRGAALASLSLHIVSVLALVAYALVVLPEHDLFTRFWRPDREVMGRVARMGTQIGLTSLAETGLFSASALIMGLIGTLELAAHGIAIQIAALFFMVHVGLSNAATVRAGRAFGAGDIAGLRRGAAAVTMLSLGFAGVAILCFLTLPDQMIGAFLDPDEPLRDEILAIGRRLLVVAALFQLVDAAQVIALGLLRGVQDTRVPMFLAIISYWLLGIPLAWVLGIQAGWGGVGVWMGLVLGLSAAASTMMHRFWFRVARAPSTP